MFVFPLMFVVARQWNAFDSAFVLIIHSGAMLAACWPHVEYMLALYWSPVARIFLKSRFPKNIKHRDHLGIGSANIGTKKSFYKIKTAGPRAINILFLPQLKLRRRLFMASAKTCPAPSEGLLLIFIFDHCCHLMSDYRTVICQSLKTIQHG